MNVAASINSSIWSWDEETEGKLPETSVAFAKSNNSDTSRSTETQDSECIVKSLRTGRYEDVSSADIQSLESYVKSMWRKSEENYNKMRKEFEENGTDVPMDGDSAQGLLTWKLRYLIQMLQEVKEENPHQVNLYKYQKYLHELKRRLKESLNTPKVNVVPIASASSFEARRCTCMHAHRKNEYHGRSETDQWGKNTNDKPQKSQLTLVNRKNPQLKCSFCISNGEEDIYHPLKDAAGNVTCPVLFKFTCRLCGATGPKAHTQKFCPQNPVTRGDPIGYGMPPGLLPDFLTFKSPIIDERK